MNWETLVTIVAFVLAFITVGVFCWTVTTLLLFNVLLAPAFGLQALTFTQAVAVAGVLTVFSSVFNSKVKLK